LANKRHIQKRHENFIGARGSRDSDIWLGACSNGSQMSESNHARWVAKATVAQLNTGETFENLKKATNGRR
jgi:hypothetical protein